MEREREAENAKANGLNKMREESKWQRGAEKGKAAAAERLLTCVRYKFNVPCAH